MKNNKHGVVIFIEGETDEIFYKYIVKHLLKKSNGKRVVDIIEYRNLKGVGNYANKAPNIFKNEILRDNPNTEFKIICAYAIS